VVRTSAHSITAHALVRRIAATTSSNPERNVGTDTRLGDQPGIASAEPHPMPNLARINRHDQRRTRQRLLK